MQFSKCATFPLSPVHFKCIAMPRISVKCAPHTLCALYWTECAVHLNSVELEENICLKFKRILQHLDWWLTTGMSPCSNGWWRTRSLTVFVVKMTVWCLWWPFDQWQQWPNDTDNNDHMTVTTRVWWQWPFDWSQVPQDTLSDDKNFVVKISNAESFLTMMLMMTTAMMLVMTITIMTIWSYNNIYNFCFTDKMFGFIFAPQKSE